MRTGEAPMRMRNPAEVRADTWRVEEETERVVGLRPRGDGSMTEIIFEVTEDDVDGGYSASALGYGIHTEGDSLEEIRTNVKAVDCYFDDDMPRPKLIRLWPRHPGADRRYFDDDVPRPKLIRLHFVRDEVLVA